MEATVILVTGAVECLVILFFAGRSCRARIKELEREVQELKRESERLNNNPFIRMGNKYA